MPCLPNASRGHSPAYLSPVTVRTRYDFSTSANSATTLSGLNGALRSTKQSSMARSPLAVRDRHCHAVDGSARGVAEGAVGDVAQRRPDMYTGLDRVLDKLEVQVCFDIGPENREPLRGRR